MTRLWYFSFAVLIAYGCAQRSPTANATATPTPAHATIAAAPHHNANSAANEHVSANAQAHVSTPNASPAAAVKVAAQPHEKRSASAGNTAQVVSTPAPQPITPAPQATTPTVIIEPPDAPPQFVAVSVDKSVAHVGETVSADITTSSNVASVEARVAGHSAVFDKVGMGHFTLAYVVPRLPFFLRKTYMIQLIARNTAGVAVSTAVPIQIR